MQLIVSHIKAWCDENELKLSPDKSKLVLFTHKRKFHLHMPIMIDDTPIHYTKGPSTKDVRPMGRGGGFEISDIPGRGEGGGL